MSCALSAAPECGGTCPAGEICATSADGASCRCDPAAVACSIAQAPACNGSCPAGEECIESAAGAGCSCSPPVVTCPASPAPTCGGLCQDGSVCRASLAGDVCRCEPVGTECDKSPAPTCGGFCGPGLQCQVNASTSLCECAHCTDHVPHAIGEVLWISDTEIRWEAQPCAVTYNVYRLTTTGLEDRDGDGLADDYGSCYQTGLPTNGTMVSGAAPPGSADFFLFTAVGAAGEGPFNTNSAGMTRPNRNPCP